mmetsp:Transcript_39297/g.103631  ORF Transcript_39297/g.103631 Transcript_39297/m.103631 type:complete len:241 (-) Transcript_39297:391-1113(-)
MGHGGGFEHLRWEEPACEVGRLLGLSAIATAMQRSAGDERLKEAVMCLCRVPSLIFPQVALPFGRLQCVRQAIAEDSLGQGTRQKARNELHRLSLLAGRLQQRAVLLEIVALGAILRVQSNKGIEINHAIHEVIKHGLVAEIEVFEYQIDWRPRTMLQSVPAHLREQLRLKLNDARHRVHLADYHQRVRGSMLKGRLPRQRVPKSRRGEAECLRGERQTQWLYRFGRSWCWLRGQTGHRL